jgi:hypothetical protein
MIYTSTVISDEMEKPFVGESNHKWKVVVDALLICALSFVISTVFSTLSDTVIGEKFALFSDKSAFSIISLVNIITAIFVSCYLYVHYQRMTFNDLYNNKMYMLLKLGQKARTIVYFRIISILVYTLTLYLISFILSLVMCLIFSYELSLGNQFNLIILGLIFSMSSSISALAISTFIKERKYGIGLFVVIMICFVIFAFYSGFYDVISSSSKMMYLNNVFVPGATHGFIYVLLGFSLFNLGEILFSCKMKAMYYHTSLAKLNNMVVIDYSSNKVIEPKKDYSLLFRKITRIFNIALFSLICLSALVTNFYLISIGSKNISNEYSAGTEISMIFGSGNMSPDIYENDFVTFRVLSNKEEVKEGDIVYYQKSETSSSGSVTTYTAVVKVININNSTDYNVNVSNPTSGVDMADTLTRSQIEGKMIYSSRALGAWIVFNQSVIGKIIMIGVPTFVILFYDNLNKLTKAYKKVEEDEVDEKDLVK